MASSWSSPGASGTTTTSGAGRSAVSELTRASMSENAASARPACSARATASGWLAWRSTVSRAVSVGRGPFIRRHCVVYSEFGGRTCLGSSPVRSVGRTLRASTVSTGLAAVSVTWIAMVSSPCVVSWVRRWFVAGLWRVTPVQVWGRWMVGWSVWVTECVKSIRTRTSDL